MSNSAELKLLRPRLVALGGEQQREAITLLSDLLLDAAGKRRDGVSDGALDSVCGGATTSVVPFPEKRGKARKAA